MAIATKSAFVEGLLQSQLLSEAQCEEVLRLQNGIGTPRDLAQEILRRAWLTPYQVNQIFHGKGGDLVIGPYVVLERIGEGGMGQVFKARQKVLNRIVALKVIRKECLSNPRVILRFQREIRAAGQLNHPHIVRAFDADQVNGTYFIAMEYIEGTDLAKLVAKKGPLPVKQACEYIRQAALGLQHAFERGMVHRDIKPANLLVTKAISSDRRRSSGMIPRPILLPSKSKGGIKQSSSVLPRIDGTSEYRWGVVKILDMGLARCSDPLTGRTSTHLTQLGSLMGTPEYIAPEQARDSHTSDIRADLYSLGCTFYFLLTGHPPFPTGNVTEKVLQHQFDVPEPVADARCESLLAWNGTNGPVEVSDEALHVPASVEAVIRRLMAKNPAERHQTPSELADELEKVIHQLSGGKPAKLKLEETAIPVVPHAVALPVDAPAAGLAPTVLEQAPSKRSPVPHRSFRTRSWVVAGLSAFALFAIATVLGVLMVRHSLGQAGVAEADPTIKTDRSNEPYWKVAIRKAVDKKISWEEARQELIRQRSATSNLTQAKKIDEWLARLPSPMDSLERSTFGASLPAGLPADVVGVYGLGKPPVSKTVGSLAVSRNGRWLVTAEDNGVRVFDVAASIFPYKIPAHTAKVNRVAISPDGWMLASAGDDGAVRTWDLGSRNRLQSFEKHQRPVTQIAFHPDGSLIASAGRDGAIRLWDPRTNVEMRKIDNQFADVTALTFSPDGRDLFWGGNTAEIHWTSVKAPQIGTSKSGGETVGKFAIKHANPRVLAFQPSGNVVLIGGAQGFLHVCTWDGKVLTETATLQGQRQVHHAAFSPDGKTFATVGVELSAIVWDVSKLQPAKSMNTLRSAGFSAAFAPDGRHLLMGGASNQVLVLRLASHDMTALRAALD